jgi:predicted DsbA family dithiol-disulfide isomerase
MIDGLHGVNARNVHGAITVAVYMNRTNDTVIIAHDYLCPWCWVGFFQAKWLKEEFPQIKQDWRGYELLPEALGPIPAYNPQPRNPNAPPSRLDQLAAIEGLVIPRDRTIGAVRTHDALQGAEYVKDKAPDLFDNYNEAVYRAYWEQSQDISSHDVLGRIIGEIGLNPPDFIDAVSRKAYSDKVVGFDDDAYADDVTHVPTFIFRGERCAEAPYSTIRDLALRFMAWYGPK